MAEVHSCPAAERCVSSKITRRIPKTSNTQITWQTSNQLYFGGVWKARRMATERKQDDAAASSHPAQDRCLMSPRHCLTKTQEDATKTRYHFEVPLEGKKGKNSLTDHSDEPCWAGSIIPASLQVGGEASRMWSMISSLPKA